MKIEVETHVAAAPDIVYAVVTDIAHWPDFIRSIDLIEILTAGAVTDGMRFRETRTMFGRSATEEMTVAKLAPPHRFDLIAENHGTRYLAVHDIAPAAGGSRLRLVFEVTPVTLAAKMGAIIGLMFKGAVTNQLRSDLTDIKAEAERRAQR
jgi:Polyketide cyclase / dehydrase and lipid transport